MSFDDGQTMSGREALGEDTARISNFVALNYVHARYIHTSKYVHTAGIFFGILADAYGRYESRYSLVIAFGPMSQNVWIFLGSAVARRLRSDVSARRREEKRRFVKSRYSSTPVM